MTTPLVPQLRTHGLCETCEQATHTDGEPQRNGGRGWVHTGTDLYRCTDFVASSRGGFVAPMLSDTSENRLDDAYHDGFETGKDEGRDEGFEEGKAEGHEDGLKEGQDDAYRLFSEVIDAQNNPYRTVTAENVVDELRAILDRAVAEGGVRG